MLLTTPTFWGITISAFFYCYFNYFCLTWLPSYLVMARGYSFLKMGAYTAAPYVGTIVVSFASARLADRMIARAGHPILIRKVFVTAGFVLGSGILFLLVFSVLSERACDALLAVRNRVGQQQLLGIDGGDRAGCHCRAHCWLPEHDRQPGRSLRAYSDGVSG